MSDTARQRSVNLIVTTAVILLWAIMFIMPLLFGDNSDRNWRAIYVLWSQFSLMLFAFIVNRALLMPYLFFKKRYFEYIFAALILLLIIALFIGRFEGISRILELLGYPAQSTIPRRAHIPQPIIPRNISILVSTTLIMLLDLGLNIAVKWMLAEQRQATLKGESVSAQLANLQNQVSPHFFMNTLNNIYALVGIDPPKAQETILELSGLMDYLLYESSTSRTVALSRELVFIHNYVNLMQLRYPKRVDIKFECMSDTPQVNIPPLLFLNFIENAFKYGVDYSKESFIEIVFTTTNDHIEMFVKNSNHANSVKRSHKGLGIANSRKRLERIYDTHYTLDIIDSEDIFSVTLKIPIVCEK